MKEDDFYDNFNENYKWYEKSWNRIYYIMSQVFNIMLHLRRIKWFFQRGIRGWADCDTWSLDMYISKIISESAIYLSNNVNGYPSELLKKYSEDEAFLEWKKILRRISYAYKKYYSFLDSDLYLKIVKKYGKRKGTKIYEKIVKRNEQERKLLVEWFSSLWN